MKQIDFYDLKKPFSSASIFENADKTLFYQISEPEMSIEKQKLFQKILRILNDSLNPELFEKETDQKIKTNQEVKTETENIKTVQEKLKAEVLRLLSLYSIRLNETDSAVFFYYIDRDFFGFSTVQPLLEDSEIEDISCSGPEIPIFIFHRKYGPMPTNIILSKNEADTLIRKMAQCSGKSITVAEPMTDAVLPGGSRAQLTLGSEITAKGSTFTIRKFNENPFTPFELVQNGTFTPTAAAYLWLCIESNMNMMFAGGTASGKTTSLNAFCRFIPINKKIVSIEDTAEINLPHLNWISGISRERPNAGENQIGQITLYDLLKASLRQRPEYILVGEIRGSEAYVLFQAMSTGHTTLSTMHAESVETLIHRLENPPMNVPRVMIQTLDVLVILTQIETDGRFYKKCLSIHEILETDPMTSEILTREIFNSADDTPHIDCEMFDLKKSSVLEKTRIRKGWTFEMLETEFEKRRRLIHNEGQAEGQTERANGAE